MLYPPLTLAHRPFPAHSFGREGIKGRIVGQGKGRIGNIMCAAGARDVSYFHSLILFYLSFSWT